MARRYRRPVAALLLIASILGACGGGGGGNGNKAQQPVPQDPVPFDPMGDIAPGVADAALLIVGTGGLDCGGAFEDFPVEVVDCIAQALLGNLPFFAEQQRGGTDSLRISFYSYSNDTLFVLGYDSYNRQFPDRLGFSVTECRGLQPAVPSDATGGLPFKCTDRTIVLSLYTLWRPGLFEDAIAALDEPEEDPPTPEEAAFSLVGENASACGTVSDTPGLSNTGWAALDSCVEAGLMGNTPFIALRLTPADTYFRAEYAIFDGNRLFLLYAFAEDAQNEVDPGEIAFRLEECLEPGFKPGLSGTDRGFALDCESVITLLHGGEHLLPGALTRI